MPAHPARRGPAAVAGARRELATTRARTLLRRLGFASAAIVLLAVVLLAIRLAPLFLAPNAYAGVSSIENSATYRDPALMRAAWSMPVAARYRRLPFEYQRNQSVCGATSVANVLHSMGHGTTQEMVLVNSPKPTWFGYLLGGLTLDELADLLSRSTSRQVRVLRDLDAGQFRATLRLANDPRYRIVANFHRGPLFGRGHGHISPILAYLPDRDLVLVGDVNAQYRPFLVGTERLRSAVDTLDPETGKMRGLVVLALE